MTSFRTLLLLCFLTGATGALAQTAPPAAASAAPSATSVASPGASTCVKPGPYPGRKVSDARKEAWSKEIKGWGDCIRNYVAELRAEIDAKIKVANATIESYNAGVKELQDDQKKAEGIVD